LQHFRKQMLQWKIIKKQNEKLFNFLSLSYFFLFLFFLFYSFGSTTYPRTSP
jgi:hypothetical protein